MAFIMRRRKWVYCEKEKMAFIVRGRKWRLL
jgi:hypothetical protein